MKPLSHLLFTLHLTAASLLVHTISAAPEPANPPLKVMSFNIRYGAANDGTNSWPHRSRLVLETIQTFDPDLLGLQEVLGFQADYLKERLPGYAFHGVGREDGVAKGEFVPLMYKRDRFELSYSGHFWLSETPELPGSKSWDSSLPRMLSWVILRDRHVPDRPFVFANVHFDHRGPQARLESARLIRQRAAEIQDEHPVVLTGDFNTTEDDPPYAVLVRGEGFQNHPFVDTYRAIHPERSPNEASFSSWIGVRQGSRIDWVLHSPEFNTLNSAINYTQEAGRYPSDHYPVEAVLRLR
jgi:endonuclease/exonuclease/phosphatase family metal-dependent hydrolase